MKRAAGSTRFAAFVVVVSTAFVLLAPTAVPAAEEKDAQGELIERIKQEVIRELRESGLLDQEIDEGISRFIVRQQAEQARRQQQTADQRAAGVRPVDLARDHIRGDPKAEISLIEYSDFECPFCKRFHPTAKQMLQAYRGRVNWVYRHFPLENHNPAALREAEASECAAALGGNDAFWKYADLLFARTASNGNGVPADQLAPMAAEIGLDATRFRECLDSGRMRARVQKDLADGQAIGITGTPANILRSNRTGAVVTRTGARPLEHFKPAIDQLLKQ